MVQMGPVINEPEEKRGFIADQTVSQKDQVEQEPYQAKLKSQDSHSAVHYSQLSFTHWNLYLQYLILHLEYLNTYLLTHSL